MEHKALTLISHPYFIHHRTFGRSSIALGGHYLSVQLTTVNIWQSGK